MSKRPHTFVTVAAAFVLGVVHFFYYQQRMLASPYHFNDDVVQHYAWLFGGDWTDPFYATTSGEIQPWGFRALLYLLSPLTDAVTLSHYGPLLITVLITVYATCLLRKAFPLVLALAGAYLIAQMTIFTGHGFLARGFSTPLLLMFAYYLVDRSAWGIAVSLILAGVFYPPVLLINGFILAPFMLAWTARRPWRTRGWSVRPYAIIVGGALLAGLLTYLQAWTIEQSPRLGELFTRAELLSMPEFGGRGRVIFTNITNTPTEWMLRYYQRLLVGIWPAPDFGLFLLASAAVLCLVTRRRTAAVGAYVILLFVVTAGLYHLARVMTPKLFMADRYLQYPWRMGVPLLYGYLAGALWAVLPRWWTAVPLSLVLVFLGYRHMQPEEYPVISVSDKAAMYERIRELPPDALLAAPPQEASFIPLVTRRSVLLGHEQAHALYFRHYYDYVTPRYRDYQHAVTADSLDQVVAFLDRYGVDYLLLDRNFLENSDRDYFEPYRTRFTELTQDRPADDFALLRVPATVGDRFKNDLQLVSRSQLDSLARLTAD